MWFAYVDNSMAWHDLGIDDVKTMIAANKRGEKCLPLEEYKNQDMPKVKEVDLIQENNVDRFEKKRSPKRNRPSSGEKKPAENKEIRDKKVVLKPKDNAPTPPNTTAQPPQQQKTPNKKNKKRYPPKRDNNNG